MKRKLLMVMLSFSLVLVLVSVLVVGTGARSALFPPPRAIDPIVSTDWLEDNLGIENLVILDVRTPDEYTAGHIPNSINSPSSDWYINPPFGPDWPWMELPAVEDLFNTIGSAGITDDSLVVVVGRTVDPFAVYALADATRVAVTLLYAGIGNVAILDGGYDKWAAEGRAVSTEPVTPTPVAYSGVVNEAMFVSKDYVAKRIRKPIIVDARDPDVYFGVTLEPWTVRAGHIPGAKCLSTPWLWTFVDGVGTYKDTDVLRAMAFGVLGRPAFFREVVVYCGVGGYASTAYFVLSEVLGYKNVKIYDGSAQEWTADPNAPVVLYKWE